MNLEINTDSFAVKAQIKADIKRVLPVLSQQILQYCNYFCKQDQGGLIASSQTASNFEEGTQYSKFRFNNGNTLLSFS